MTTIKIGPWTVEADAAATRGCYAQLGDSFSEGCTCDPCKNFALVREQAYPPEIVALFQQLGVDSRQVFELSHYSRMPSGLHLYGGWHYICGSIKSGPDSVKGTNPYQINPTFAIELTHTHQARQPFSGFSCVQVDFYAELPWVSDLPEAD
jgi:hypothetical protein